MFLYFLVDYPNSFETILRGCHQTPAEVLKDSLQPVPKVLTMAFFEIKDCDLKATEAIVDRSLHSRNIPLQEAAALLRRFGEERPHICHLLVELDRERFRLQFELEQRIQHIKAIHSTLSWRITTLIRAVKRVFVPPPKENKLSEHEQF